MLPAVTAAINSRISKGDSLADPAETYQVAVSLRFEVPKRYVALVRRFGLPVLLAAIYLGAAVRLTEPLGDQFSTALVGYGDTYWQAWGMWWTKYALLDLHRSPFITNYLLHPLSTNASVDVVIGFHSLLSVP